MRRLPALLTISLALLLAACGSAPKRSESTSAPVTAKAKPAAAETGAAPALPAAKSGRGGYYQDDGPPDKVPENLAAVPDAVPKVEPYSVPGNRPYVIFGKTYTPITDDKPFKQRGTGTWYGKQFHGQKTSSGEIYDMFKMTAAHPTLPIPSYARVTNLANGAQIIVRINDRGPFHSTRIIDLSYTAALKLGYLSSGSGMLEVERLLPADILAMQKDAQGAPVLETPAVAALQKPAAAATPVAMPVAAKVEALPVALVPAGAAPDPLAELIEKSAAANEADRMPGIYLQFGAFGKLENAEALLSRLLPRWPETLPPLDIVAQGPLFRIYGGPFRDRAAAMAAITRVPAGVQKPLVVQR